MIKFLISKKSKKKLFYCLQEENSPTHFNIIKQLRHLGWQNTRFQWRAHFSEKNLEFDSKAAQILEFKHLLALLVENHCPQVMPDSFWINDHNFLEVLHRVADRYYDKNDINHFSNQQAKDLIWILKPSLQNNGQNIKIFNSLDQLHQHFFNPRRLGGDHVLQRYIHSPHLLNGHKYSIRMFVILTNYSGGYLYPHGYFNVAKQPYQPHIFSELFAHITNEHLREDEPNVIQIPSQRCDFFGPIFEKITAIVESTLRGLQVECPTAFEYKTERTLAFFGYDFMVDENFRVWLLEVNHGPCFPIQPEHILQKHLYHDFWQAVVGCFVKPIAEDQPIDKIIHSPFVRVI